MRHLGRMVAAIAAFLAVFVATSLVGTRLQDKMGIYDPRGSEGAFILCLLLMPVIPIGVAYTCATTVWRLGRRRPNERPDAPTIAGPSVRHKWRRPVIGILTAAYLFTWMFGVPSVQSFLDAEAVAAYKGMKNSYPEKVGDSQPYMKSYMAFPLLPGLIVTYHEYQVARLYGFGGWHLHLWYIGGVITIIDLPRWVS